MDSVAPFLGAAFRLRGPSGSVIYNAAVIPEAAPLTIRGGRVIDPLSGFDATADVVIADGLIRSIDEHRSDSPGVVIDAEGCIVAPGLIDIHVHFRDPHPVHPETIRSGAASAVAGGFTTVCCMPNTDPALDRVDVLRYVQEETQAADLARVLPIACATIGRQGETLAPIRALARAGAAGFSDDGDCVANPAVMRRVLQQVRLADSCFMQHCQEPELTRGGVMNAGPLAVRLALGGWPALAEEMIIERDVRLNRDIGARYHAQHVSSGESAAIIRRARAEGQPISGEASPHHLLLTEDACLEYDPHAKMNPPLRTASDIVLLKEAIADGTLTVLATDHAPHPAHTKQTDFTSASFGIVGLDCALALYARALIDDDVLDWPAMLAMMTINPARLLTLDRMGLGTLQVGGPADLTVIDPLTQWIIDPAEFASTGRNCPFAGWKVSGRSAATVVGGRLVHERLESRVAVGATR